MSPGLRRARRDRPRPGRARAPRACARTPRSRPARHRSSASATSSRSPRDDGAGVLLALAAAIAVAAFALGAAARRGPGGTERRLRAGDEGNARSVERIGIARRLRARRRRELADGAARRGTPARVERATVRAVADPRRQARRPLRQLRHRGQRVGRGADERAVPTWTTSTAGSSSRRGRRRRSSPPEPAVPPGATRRLPRYRRSDGAVRGLRPPRLANGAAQGRPHGHGHGERLRPPDALRPVRGVPARDDQEGALQVGGRRAPLVPARRLERPLAPGARRDDLGRVGGRGRRARPRLRRAVAQLADTGRRTRRSDRRGRPPASRGPGLAPDRRQRVERRRHPADGARPVPRLLPVPRGRGRAALVPDLPALARTSSSASPSTSRATRSSRTCSRSSATSRSATSSGRAATATSTTTIASRSRRSSSRDPFPYPSLRLLRRPPTIFDYAYEDFEVVGYEHHPAIRAPVAV